MATNADLIRRWFDEVWNQGREETVDAMCAQDVIGHGQAQHGADIRGTGAFQAIHAWVSERILRHPRADSRHYRASDKVVARWTRTMTHTGQFLDTPPTGRNVSVNGISIQRFVGGKIVEGWDNWDQLGLLVQLGATPPAKFL